MLLGVGITAVDRVRVTCLALEREVDRDLLVAGHTHGGQCKPPFLPPPLLPVQNPNYTQGVFDLAPGRSMHISTGIGHLLKVRFNVRPEITVFELTGSRRES